MFGGSFTLFTFIWVDACVLRIAWVHLEGQQFRRLTRCVVWGCACVPYRPDSERKTGGGAGPGAGAGSASPAAHAAHAASAAKAPRVAGKARCWKEVKCTKGKLPNRRSGAASVVRTVAAGVPVAPQRVLLTGGTQTRATGCWRPYVRVRRLWG